MELKKPHPSRLVERGIDMEQDGPTPTRIKIQEGYLGNEESQPHTRPPSPGFQYQEDKSPQLLGHQVVPLKDPTHGLTPSELQIRGSSFKGTSGIEGETEVSGIKARAGGQLSPR